MNLTTGIFWVFLTVYHEARGESALGQKNVAKVILNRASKHNWPLEKVVLARKQFSCYNKGLRDSSVWIREVEAFMEVMKNVTEAVEEWRRGDDLGDATHYYAIKGMINKKPPYWAASMEFVCEVGGHRFLREI